MNRPTWPLGCLLLLGLTLGSAATRGQQAPPPPQVQVQVQVQSPPFPAELTRWQPLVPGPVFQGAGGDTAWDQKIRERGWIEIGNDGTWHLWYTGYNPGLSPDKFLGHATSPDGLAWTRDPANPVLKTSYVEDMCIVHVDSTYYMFAEGQNDVAHLLTSADGRTWQERGPLDVRLKNGEPIPPGPYGTPTAWFENGVWYLFYERGDQGVWLATSPDAKVWTNVQDEPVLAMTPGSYDATAVAMNQIVKRAGWYYAFYHANKEKPWKNWSTCLARSKDLIHWEKYAGNPLVQNNQSSGIMVDPDGDGPILPRLYTLHPDVRVLTPDPAPASTQSTSANNADLHTLLMRATVKISHDQSTGAGFILKDEPRNRFILVTAAHVLENTPGDETTVIFHARSGDDDYRKEPTKLVIRRDGKPVWVKHATEDIAAILIDPPAAADLPEVPTAWLASDNLLRAQQIGPGTELAFLGFPHREEGSPAGFPLLREGVIASFPLFPSARNKTFYLSTNVFEGDSGGPVYLARPINGVEQAPGLIVGLISGQRFLDEEMRMVYGASKLRHRLGLAVVVQAAFISETIRLLP